METIGRADFGKPIITSRVYIPTCKWRYNLDKHRIETGCGEYHQFLSDDSFEEWYKFCPFCSGRIKVVK